MGLVYVPDNQMMGGQAGGWNPMGGQAVPDRLNQLRQNQYAQMQQPQMMQGQEQMQQAQMQQAQMNQSIIWVRGQEGADRYLMAPNTTQPLWDMDNPVIYLKSTDASGQPSMKILDYQERPSAPAVTAGSAQGITREEFASMMAKMDALNAKIEAMPTRQSRRNAKTEDEDNG